MEKFIPISDLNAMVGSSKEVKQFNIKFSEYQVRTVNNKEYIVGAVAVESTADTSFQNFHMFLSLMNIVRRDKQLPKYFNPPHLDDVIPTENIIKWCREYGLPYEEWDLWKNHDRMGFEIGHFRYRLAKLYALFLLWRAIQHEDERTLNEHMMLVGLKTEEFENLQDKIKNTKKNLALYLSNNTENIGFTSAYNETTDSFALVPRAGSLFDICYFQFATLITMPLHNGEDSRQHFKQCIEKSCQAYFWAKHGSQKYCPNCDRQRSYVKRKRSKEREARNDQ